MTTVKAIKVSIYKRNGESFANGGISDVYEDAFVAVEDGYVDVNVNDARLLKLVRGAYDGTVIAVGYGPPPGDKVGPMMGGSYVGTSDARFRRAAERIVGGRFYGAVPLHDRYETVAEYEALSR